MNEDRALIFVHTPRTAGTTLRPIISRQYAPDLVLNLDAAGGFAALRNLPVSETGKIRLFMGHHKFGVHTELGVPANYLTMFRDPVERVISHYYWIKSSVGNSLHAEVSKMRLQDFAVSGLPHATNQQTEFTSGAENPQDARSVAVAMDNLDAHFKAFGIVEYFDQSLLLFKKLLGWRNIYYLKRHVAIARPRKAEFPKTTIELIRKHNGPDIELYEFAKGRFDHLIAKEGPLFDRRLRIFRRQNRIYRMLRLTLNSPVTLLGKLQQQKPTS